MTLHVGDGRVQVLTTTKEHLVIPSYGPTLGLRASVVAVSKYKVESAPRLLTVKRKKARRPVLLVS